MAMVANPHLAAPPRPTKRAAERSTWPSAKSDEPSERFTRSAGRTGGRRLSERLDLPRQSEPARAGRSAEHRTAGAKPATQSRRLQSPPGALRSLRGLLGTGPGQPRRRNGLAPADLSVPRFLLSPSHPVIGARRTAAQIRQSAHAIPARRKRAARPSTDFGTGGILGGIAKLAAEQARANDPWALPVSGILGGIAKLQTNSPLLCEPSLPKLTNDSSDGADAFRAPPATPNGLTDPSVPPGSPEGFRTLVGFSADRSTLDEGPAATNATYYPNPLDQIHPCLVSSTGCVGGGSSNRGGGGDGPVVPGPPPRSAPRAPAPEPRTSSPNAPGSAASPASPVGEEPGPTRAGGATEGSDAADGVSTGGPGTFLEDLFKKIGPGPFAPPNGGVPLARTYGHPRTAERAQNNANGGKFGCHTCGRKDFGTKSGNPVLDHQPSQSLNPLPGAPAQGYPHCVWCSSEQGTLIQKILRALGLL
jgi:hypothetical protein